VRLKNKIALVTGAASGIGRGTAIALAKEGAEVVVGDIDADGGQETCRQIERTGGRARFAKLDVAHEEDWARVIAAIGREPGALHVLVNNAAICISKPLLEMSFESWKRQLAINLDSVFLGTKAALPLMAKSGGGSVINISSVAGLKGIPGMTGYCAAKGGVRLFTKAAALECARARNGVRVNSIHPGAIETPIWLKLGNDGEMPADAAGKNEDAMENIRAAGEEATPLGHTGLPQDIAAGVVFLASDESRFVTGTELVIDGGVMAG
jgi:NAD(P)-dependent dehydrogenase (short-subunit alcohol dehydrogenase family)